jgi:hypothetical protein
MFKVRDDATPNVAFSFGWEVDTLDSVKAAGDDWYHGHHPTPGTGDVLHLVPAPGGAAARADADLAAGAKNKDVDLNLVNNLAQGWVKTPVKPSASASASPTVSGTAGGAQAASGGGLAVTGANAMLVAGAGVVLLAIGVGIFLFTRRRRTSFTA